MVTSNYYIYICTTCNGIVDEKDKACPNCGADLGKEISKNELENIIKKGPDKAYTFLSAFYESGEKLNAMALGTMLIKRFPDTKQAKWAKEIIEKAIKIVPKKVKYNRETQKYCPNCKRVTEINRAICQCGYNFKESNFEEIDLIKRLRMKKNRRYGIGMILSGIITTIIFWNSIFSAITDSSTKPVFLLVYFSPFILIIFGIYKLISGKSFKSKDIIWSYYSDAEDSKNAEDDIPYMLCPSCKKQIMIEMKYRVSTLWFQFIIF